MPAENDRSTKDVLARAKAAADALNLALRDAAERNIALSVAVSNEPLHPHGPGPEVAVVELLHHAHQEGRRPQDLNSANDD
ncbi:hypothetical protein [Jiella sonneratiae]|uniref:Uncharacterized protein n=1 Tax=Jiella sonneratiae TaxID=2816856 RepID=A0ABS3IXF0_9HYPH|nr:hypothetical protein [Jiella sonneratiae]MBO0902089.1 hypothetical protein [Jiella sonneratiae]